MNILFITLLDLRTVSNRDIYSDLLREFAKNGHTVYAVSPIERRYGGKTGFLEQSHSSISSNINILKIRTGNIQKTNYIEKGISTLLLESQIKRGIKRHLSDVCFDLVLYSTPPVTIVNAIKYVKKRDNARTYLLLKDITPQAIVDLGALKTTGFKGIIYRYFRAKEKSLYSISDYIGCMSQANVDFLIKNNKEVNSMKVEICPNCIEPIDMSVNEQKRRELREKYGIPLDKLVFVYGGNLGKAQGIDFLIECLKRQRDHEQVFFLIIGDGTMYKSLNDYFESEKQNNFKLMRRLPKEDYDAMVGACDVGLIFLDYRFTVPNFPSRLLSYMQAKIPVLACTDEASDVGATLLNGGFGWWCKSNDVEAFDANISEICNCNSFKLGEMGKTGFNYLVEHYSAKIGYSTIVKSFSQMLNK